MSTIVMSSCNGIQFTEDKLNGLTKDYVNYLESIDLVNSEFLIKVTIDSSYKDLRAFRITSYPYLLERGEFPSEVLEYNEMKIAFFTKKLAKSYELKMVSFLGGHNFYQLQSNNGMLSNYPEWIVLVDDKAKQSIVVKDKWYQSIAEVVKELDW